MLLSTNIIDCLVTKKNNYTIWLRKNGTIILFDIGEIDRIMKDEPLETQDGKVNINIYNAIFSIQIV